MPHCLPTPGLNDSRKGDGESKSPLEMDAILYYVVSLFFENSKEMQNAFSKCNFGT